MKKDNILVIGACGQIGTELTATLREKYGWQQVIAADIHPATDTLLAKGPYVQLDVLNQKKLAYLVRHQGVKQIYHLAAVLSAKGEQNPVQAWDINMQGLLNVLEVAREQHVRQVFWPSSIAVFGNNCPRDFVPQHAPLQPATVYGISKAAGEAWCQYYFDKYGVDVRSIRYPGLISYQAKPGGGTTDYAVDIFHQALANGVYDCFLKPDTTLPMMYMADALRATLELMAAPADKIRIRTSYNLAALSFSPNEMAAEIQKTYPGFRMEYTPDFRQQIADSWPASIDDRQAREDWGWKPGYDLGAMTGEMLDKLTLNDALAHVQ